MCFFSILVLVPRAVSICQPGLVATVHKRYLRQNIYIYIDMCRISYDCHALQARLREVYDDLSGNLCGPMGQEIPTWHHNFDEASAGTYNLRLFNDDGSINKVGEASLGARALCAIIYAHKCICGACLLHQPSLLRYMRTCEKWGEMLL